MDFYINSTKERTKSKEFKGNEGNKRQDLHCYNVIFITFHIPPLKKSKYHRSPLHLSQLFATSYVSVISTFFPSSAAASHNATACCSLSLAADEPNPITIPSLTP